MSAWKLVESNTLRKGYILSSKSYSCDLFAVVTKLKRNNLRLRPFFEIEIPLRRRRQSFRFILVTAVKYLKKL